MHRSRFAAAILLGLFAMSAFAQVAQRNSDPGNAPGFVNVNEAPKESLLLLYRTSKKLADQIIEERGKTPFANAQDLGGRVRGCSPIWFKVNAPHLAFYGETTLKHRIRRPPTTQLPSFPSAPGLP